LSEVLRGRCEFRTSDLDTRDIWVKGDRCHSAPGRSNEGREQSLGLMGYAFLKVHLWADGQTNRVGIENAKSGHALTGRVACWNYSDPLLDL